jgi:hypothetical protein
MTHLLPVYVAADILVAAYGLFYSIYDLEVPIFIRKFNGKKLLFYFIYY